MQTALGLIGSIEPRKRRVGDTSAGTVDGLPGNCGQSAAESLRHHAQLFSGFP